MKKSLTIALLVVVFLAAIGGGVFYFKYASINISTDVTMAGYIKDTTVEATKGRDISVKNGEAGTYTIINGKTVLKENDFIKVGNDTEAMVTWMDDSVTRLNSGSEIHITQMELDVQDPTNTGIAFDIFNGEVWSKAMNIVNDKSTFSMRSGKNSNVIAGLRGTTLDFSVDATGTHIRAIRHAIYLVGYDVDLSQGEEADITEGDSNGNSNGENGNTNAVIKGDLLIQVNNIPDDLYTSKWFVQNFDGDKKHDDTMRGALMDKMKKQLEGIDDPMREFKMQGMIDEAKDAKGKVRLLMKLATEKLQMAVMVLSQGDKTKGQSLWNDFEKRVNQIKDVLSTIEDQDFVFQTLQKITVQWNLWLKYSYLLLPDDTDMTNAMEQLMLGLTTDPDRQTKLQTLFDARNFFAMTDQMGEGLTKEEVTKMLQRYKKLFDKMNTGHIRDYECKILLQLRDKLKMYVLDLPPVFECRVQGGGSGGAVCLNNQVRCPNGACVENLIDCRQVCPEDKIKCPNGSCADVLSDCPVSCPEGQVACPDKTCAINLRSCPRICAANQIKCPNGTCVTTLRECSVNTNRNSVLNANRNVLLKPICGNQICEKAMGETFMSCPADCPLEPVCGNQKCENGETTVSCPSDCPMKPVCGNGVCEKGETHLICPSDCPPSVLSGEVPLR